MTVQSSVTVWLLPAESWMVSLSVLLSLARMVLCTSESVLPVTSSPSIAMMMSPCLRPAFAAGESLVTAVMRKPFVLSSSWIVTPMPAYSLLEYIW